MRANTLDRSCHFESGTFLNSITTVTSDNDDNTVIRIISVLIINTILIKGMVVMSCT